MTLDLTRPEHREALKWACEFRRDQAEWCHAALERPDIFGGLREPHGTALRALSSPSDSAALVRALLEGHGLTLLRCSPDATGFPNLVIRLRDFWHTMVVALNDVPTLILALLDCTDATGALAALREAGR